MRIILLTGFLGSGKTTALGGLLKTYSKHSAIGVIINEFGRISIDGALLADNPVAMRELKGGSIFCACLKADFVNTLQTFLELPLDYLFIESSGLANPAGFHALAARIDTRCRILDVRVLCVVDAKYFLNQLDMFAAIEPQILTADSVLINKCDLVSAAQLDAVVQAIAKLNPAASIAQCVHGIIDYDMLRATNSHVALAADTAPALSPFSHVLTPAVPVSAQQLQEFLQELIPLVLRVKGFIRTLGGLVNVNVVGDVIDIQPALQTYPEALVIIAKTQLPINNQIVAIWDKYCSGAIKLT